MGSVTGSELEFRMAIAEFENVFAFNDLVRFDVWHRAKFP